MEFTLVVLEQLGQRLDFVAFACGGAWALIARAGFGTARLKQQRSWRWFGLFAGLQAVLCWTELGRYNANAGALMDLVSPVILVLSLGCLLEFGRQALGSALGRWPEPWLHAVVLVLTVAGKFLYNHFDKWVWCTLGWLACGFAAAGMLLLSRTVAYRRERWALRLLALTIAAYDLSFTVIDHFENTDPTAAVFGRNQIGSVLVVALPLILMLLITMEAIFTRYHLSALRHYDSMATRFRSAVQVLAVPLLLVLTWLAVEQVGDNRDAAMRNDVLLRAELAASAIDRNDYGSLSWSSDDLANPSYQHLKSLMSALVKSNTDLRFVLLSGYRDGHSLFLVDSEPVDSESYSPPGQVYEEAAPDYLAGMASREPFVAGPVVDRWGTWVLASVPLPDAAGAGPINAELDIAAQSWFARIREARMPVLLIAVLISLLLITYSHAKATDLETLSRLVHSEQETSSLVEGSPDCVLLIDANGRLASVNARTAEAFGIDKASLLGQAFLDLWPTAAQQSLQQLCDSTLAGNATELEADYRRPDGRLISFRVATNPIRQSSSFVCICEDITERKASERALIDAKETAEAATRAKSDFLAVMSHEIRTPLGGVIGMLDLLRRSPDRADRLRYLQLAHGSAETLLHILDDILDAAKVESGKMVFESVPFRIRDEVTYVLEAMRVRADSKRIGLDWTLPPDIPAVVIGDPTRIKQVLANLLSNAIKFTTQGGVTVHFGQEDADRSAFMLVMAVSDTGVGIPPDVLPRLFGKFVQADASTTRQYGGTGLGLAIIKGMVERMGGSICVDSTLGQGTTFTARIPLWTATESLLLAEEAETGGQNAGAVPAGLRLLCAEDDLVNREYLQSLLAELGLPAVFVDNGLDAVNLLKREHFDAVLMDNRMPVMDGFQATRAIRDPDTRVLDPRITIIAVTANASPGYREECLSAGMNDYLTKPLRRRELLNVLARVARQRGKQHNAFPGRDAPLVGMSEDELLAMIDEQDGGDADATPPAAVPKVVQVYLQEAPKRLQEMRKALQICDFSALGRAAHTLKGSSGYVAADELGRLGATIERCAEANDMAGMYELLDAAEAEFAAVATRLNPELRQVA